MDLFINDHLSIPERELVFTASRSRGPGGQHVNKVNSRLTLHFDIQKSPNLTATQRAKICSLLATRITVDGVFRLDCQKHRMQSMNRAELIDRFVDHLRGALLPKRFRVPTRISKSVKERRLDQKKHQGRTKKRRSSLIERDE
ncbi:alternative ribosome rescue aminoacyl-tRNA hydrolase ArfB [Candidatus Nitrospira salsa]|nr:MAG: aminoacyl-tRNA hydrolase [Nitrospirales bacterium]